MNHDDFERSLVKFLKNLPVRHPEDSLADQIVSFATAHPQNKNINAAQIVRGFLSSLLSPWPDDLFQKAAVLGMVAILMFSAGMAQGLGTGVDEENEILSLVYADFENTEIL